MVGTLALAGAQVGLSLFQARETQRAAVQSAYTSTYQAHTEKHLQEMQAEREWEVGTRLRTEALQRILGSQRAGYASAGVGGGRSVRLAEMTSRWSALREQREADFGRAMGAQVRNYQTTQRVSAAGTTATAAIKQSNIDLFSSLLQTGQQVHSAVQAKAAQAAAASG